MIPNVIFCVNGIKTTYLNICTLLSVVPLKFPHDFNMQYLFLADIFFSTFLSCKINRAWKNVAPTDLPNVIIQIYCAMSVKNMHRLEDWWWIIVNKHSRAYARMCVWFQFISFHLFVKNIFGKKTLIVQCTLFVVNRNRIQLDFIVISFSS